MRTLISDDTKITLGIVVALLGGMGFVTSLAFQTNSNAAAIEKMQRSSDERNEKLDQIATDIAVIKTKLGFIQKKLDNQNKEGQ